MKITTVGVDLAKNVFQVHGIDERDVQSYVAETRQPSPSRDRMAAL